MLSIYTTQPCFMMLVKVKTFVVAKLAAVAVYGSAIPLRLIQTAPAGFDRAGWVSYTSALVAMGFEHELFDDARALAFIEEHYPGTKLRSVYRKFEQPVMRSSIFRPTADSKFDGFCMDMDTIVPAGWHLEELAAQPAAAFRKERWQISNGVFGAVAGHPFVLDALEEAVRRSASLLASKNASDITDLDVLR